MAISLVISRSKLYIYMPKGLKYKKGFTLRHHFDESWDRLDYGLKLKIKAFLLIFIIWGGCSGVGVGESKIRKYTAREGWCHNE